MLSYLRTKLKFSCTFFPSSFTISQTKHTPPHFSNKFIFVRQTTQALFHIAKSLIAILGALFFPTTNGLHSISKYTHIPIRSLLFAKKTNKHKLTTQSGNAISFLLPNLFCSITAFPSICSHGQANSTRFWKFWHTVMTVFAKR